MVSDLLSNAPRYAALGRRVARGLRFLAETDLATLAVGRHEIDGERLFVLVSEYVPKAQATCRWEAHRKYIDLQYVVSGVERIGVAPAASMRETGCEADRDLVWLEGEGDFLTLGAGRFVLLWPGDAHMPGVATDPPESVRKVVVKIAL